MINVYLIGAGPGNPKLISLRAIECLSKSDVVLYDRLVNRDILRHAKVGAKLVYVGKRSEGDSAHQEYINKTITEYAHKGLVVARLKGGDPFLFGRGAEEAEHILGENLTFEIVPGITSAISVPAFAGIPVTHRDFSTQVHIISGTCKEEDSSGHMNYALLAKLEGTLIFMMGIRNLSVICKGLVENGKDPKTPVALVENGTTNSQRVTVGNVDNIAELAKSNNVKPPAIIVIGGVAGLHEKLDWFKPLKKKVILTRDIHQTYEISSLLEESGFEAVLMPMIEIRETDHSKDDMKYIENIQEYKWIVFTSINGVDYFFKKLKRNKVDFRRLSDVKMIAVGNATSQCLEGYGFYADAIPNVHNKGGISGYLMKKIRNGDSILIPGSDIGSHEEFKGLENAGIVCDKFDVYKTVNVTYEPDEFIPTYFGEGNAAIAFTSPSTVQSFIRNMRNAGVDPNEKMKIICIGDTTSREAISHGLKVDGISGSHSAKGIIDKIKELI